VVQAMVMPSPRLQRLVIEDVAVQSWTDANDITSLIRDGNDLWAGTSGGLVRWNLISGDYHVYTTRDGLPGQVVTAIAQDGGGHIWLIYADTDSWSEYDKETWHTYESREVAVTSRYEVMLKARHFDPRLWHSGAGSKLIWLPTHDGCVMSYDGSTWRSYDQAEGVTTNCRLVSVSDAGQLWVVGDGISTAIEADLEWERHPFSSALPDGSDIGAIAVDKQGGLWLALTGPHRLNEGAIHLDPASGNWACYRHELDPAIPRQVHSVEVDSEGVVWLCGDGGITFRRPGERWHQVPTGELIVQCFARGADSRFWLGTDYGIWSMASDGSDVRGPWLVPSPLVGNKVTQLVMDGREKLWMGTPKGLSWVDRHGEAKLLREGGVLCLAPSPRGQVWMGDRSTLSIVESDGVARQVLDQGALAVAFDSSKVPWVCTVDGDLIKMTDSSWQDVTSIRDVAGLVPRDMVIGDDGTVWIATRSGLGMWSTSGEFAMKVIGDGLPHLDVHALAQGPDDALWIATAHGLARRLPSGKWTRFTTASTEGGLRSMEIWDLFADGEGTLWMATSSGVSARTRDADWSYFDLPGARSVCAEPGGAVWIGTLGGLYRIRQEALTSVP